MTRPEQPRPRPSPAERRERRAAIDDVGVVLDAAARFLEARPRSIAEVRRRLTTAGYRADLVDAAVARMTDLGYLDDEAFARAWVESRDRARPRGRAALRRELALKGVDRAIVDNVLGERVGSDGGEDDRDRATRLLERHRRALEREPDARRRRQKAYALLARNGFDPSTAAELARAWGEDEGARAEE